ncbi:MAG: hypothetical protein U5M23_00270 [Marinagarivorans sp.]|nr:hypothetical protein [Marinagarivorans sp.]
MPRQRTRASAKPASQKAKGLATMLRDEYTQADQQILDETRLRFSALVAGDPAEAPAPSVPTLSVARQQIVGRADLLPPDPDMIAATMRVLYIEADTTKVDRWLKSAAPNRAVNSKRVVQYARRMARAEWLDYFPQGLIFDQEGRLIEGQHRLLAYLKAAPEVDASRAEQYQRDLSEGKQPLRPKPFVIGWAITVGAPNGIQIALDSGQPRAIAQTGKIIGLNTSALAIAITKALWIDPAPSNGKIPRITDYNKVLSAFKNYEEGIRFACQKFAGKSSVTVAAVRAAIARAYYYCDNPQRDRLLRFVEVLDTGLSSDKLEFPAVLTRNAYLDALKRGESANLELHRKTLWAIDAFIKEKSPTYLRQAKHQLFPLDDFEPDHKALSEQLSL